MTTNAGFVIANALQKVLSGSHTADELCRALNAQPLRARDIPADQQLALRQIIQPYLDQPDCWTKDWNTTLLLASILQHYVNEKDGARHLIQGFLHCTDRQKRAQLFFQLRCLNFSENLGIAEDMQDLYFQLYEDWFGHTPPIPPYQPAPRRAVILISQYLEPPHAPTVDAIAKAHILHDVFGYDVAIINAREMAENNALLLANKCSANRLPELHGFQILGTPDQPLKLFTPTGDMPSVEGYVQICAFVAAWQPAFILNYGIFNLCGEFLGNSGLVITMPAGIELLPTRTSRYAVSFRPLAEEDKRMIAHIGMEKVGIIETTYNYDKPTPTEKYHRQNFQLNADDIVVTVVSNRLTDEMTPQNIAFMTRILALDSRIRLVLIGYLTDSNKKQLQTYWPEERVKLAGYVMDVPAFYEQIADLYINPYRGGGGTSAAHALAFGIPAFTLAFGHVANLTHPDFVFENEDALLAAIRMAIRPDMRAAFRQKALQGFARIGSRERMLRDILSQAGLLTG